MSKKNLQDLEFVLGEIVNRQRDFAEGGKPEVRDAFCTIPHPSGRGSLIVGRAGFEAMDRLAEVAARAAGMQKRVKLTDVRTNIGKLISERFLGEGQELSDKTVAKMLNEAGRRAKATLGKRTYLIPCHLSTRTEPDPIVLGPVRFIGTAGAHGRIRKAFFRLRAESEHYRRDRSWMLQALRYYRGFRWFAEVEVEGCDGDRAAAIAREAATAALNFVQLVIGPRHSHRMLIEGTPNFASRTASLHLTGEDDLHFETRVGYLGEVGLPDGWAAEMAKGEYGDALRRAGTVLEMVVNPDLDRPLSQRMLDAVQWYGEAVRDTSPSTRIVKYVTALERLILTGEKFEELTDAASDRVAALCMGIEPGKGFAELKTEFKRVYDVRSGLVHGSISLSSPKVRATLGAAATFSEHALKQALHSWHETALRDTGKDQTRLQKWFEDLMTLARAADAENE